ncbi:TBC1 domain family member 10A [Tachysurus vachellii]|uniref:TBC1 domain family member 10A n=1 Tax=Tachysurus vachellii TaxID=175792 RepID=UPI00296B0312|nr:TBC1 domain family member 10A [Tachysurus vachellii]XP_060737429.1 TBC1 domain family member 10A [Tachysurus vachellii]
MMADDENGDQSLDTVSLQTEGSHFGDDGESSLGSDSELNGMPGYRETDKYGFIGGAQKYSAESAEEVPPAVLRQRELKWLDMLKDWDKWINKRFKKVRLRCQKGIPPSIRGRAWLYLSGGKVKKEQNSTIFKELESKEGDPKWIDVIERDLHRQFPFHEMFVSRTGHGQQDLLRVLKAYTLYRPDEGYCQAQAPIAAVLLMHMPAEDAFWGLVQICEKYLPGYYSAGLEAVQLDGEILHALLKRVCPTAYRHLDKHKIEPVLYMMEWFMCAFSRTLPWASVLRVWDMFLCDGVKIIFRVGLVLLKSMLGTRDKLKACPGQYETMEVLRAIEPKYMQEAFLVHQVLEMQVSARDVERAHRTQLKRWRKKRGEPTRKPPLRMHSARAIISNEPHTRQDLHQNPSIIVPFPSIPKEIAETSLKKKRGSMKRNQLLNIPNPYALPIESKLGSISETQPLNNENQYVVLPNPPSYPAQLPTEQKNQVRETKVSTERLVQSLSNSTVSPTPGSLPLQHLSLLPSLAHESTPEWRPHLLDSPRVLFPKPVPDHDDLPNNTEKSAAIQGQSTDPSSLLTHNEDSTAVLQDKNGVLHNSAESICSSEDTYL